jgi:hypothetical protein
MRRVLMRILPVPQEEEATTAELMAVVAAVAVVVVGLLWRGVSSQRWTRSMPSERVLR